MWRLTCDLWHGEVNKALVSELHSPVGTAVRNRDRHVDLLRVLGELVEVGADLAVCSCGLVRMAAVAAVRGEDALAGRNLLDRPDNGVRERSNRTLVAATRDAQNEQCGGEENDGLQLKGTYD